MGLEVNLLRAAGEIREIEKARVKEEARAEVQGAKRELRTLSKRMAQQCTREVKAPAGSSSRRAAGGSRASPDGPTKCPPSFSLLVFFWPRGGVADREEWEGRGDGARCPPSFI